MQAEQRGQCLILLLCAWAFLTAGPALCVYGAQEKEQNTKAAWEERAFSEHQARQLRHWNIGDTVTRKIDGKSYRFRCIDQNYADHMGGHKSGALFLCDEVIPANTGSRYEFETPGTAITAMCINQGRLCVLEIRQITNILRSAGGFPALRKNLRMRKWLILAWNGDISGKQRRNAGSSFRKVG